MRDLIPTIPLPFQKLLRAQLGPRLALLDRKLFGAVLTLHSTTSRRRALVTRKPVVVEVTRHHAGQPPHFEPDKFETTLGCLALRRRALADLSGRIQGVGDLIDVYADPPNLPTNLAKGLQLLPVPLRPPGQMDERQGAQPTGRCRSALGGGPPKRIALFPSQPDFDLLALTCSARRFRRPVAKSLTDHPTERG